MLFQLTEVYFFQDLKRSTFEKAQRIAESRGGENKREKNKYDFLYKGFVACKHCGKPLMAGYSKGGSGKKHLYYFCRCKNPKKVKNIPVKKIVDAFEAFISKIQFSDQSVNIIDDYITNHLEKHKAQMRDELKQRKRELKTIKTEKKDLYKDFKKGILDKETYEDMDSEIDERKLLCKMALNESQIDYDDLLTQLRTFLNFGYNIINYWNVASHEQKGFILSSIVQCTPLYSDGRLLNVQISPLYKALKDLSDIKNSSGVEDGT